jgi:alpha-1,2-mannosyltransferase
MAMGIGSVAATALTSAALRLFLALRGARAPRASSGGASNVPVVAFMHPYCNAGGGGERVLWCAVKALAERRAERPCEIVVYTGDTDVSLDEALSRVRRNFGMRIPTNAPLSFCRLRHRRSVEARTWPRFTLLGQSLGSIVLAWEALLARRPDVWIDTTGLAFTLPLARIIGGCRTAAYVHYPTISTDMLSLVRSRRASYNNRDTGYLRSRAKLLYYRAFAALYAAAGRCCDTVMCNSSWTEGHIRSLWGTAACGPDGAAVLFPPCDTEALQKLPLTAAARARAALPEGSGHGAEGLRSLAGRRLLLSIGQFRPEKDHAKQLRALRILLDASQPGRPSGGRPSGGRSKGCFDNVLLVLLGSCRDDGDVARVDALRALARTLGLCAHVRFVVNAPYALLRALLGRCEMGLHTMEREHFGIGVVEMMAAGCVPVAHASGGPKRDIIGARGGNEGGIGKETRVGFLASTAEEYAEALAEGLSMPVDDLLAVRRRGRARAALFSQEAFEAGFSARTASLLDV